MPSFYAHGKLLLSGEYAVLHGAEALALPVRFGQRLDISSTHRKTNIIYWESYSPDGSSWFFGEFSTSDFFVESSNSELVAERLSKVLTAAKELNLDFMAEGKSHTVKAHLEFDRTWGLGSSSTLISLVAQWANVDPFELLAKTFGGSGYDVACALAEGPILYKLVEQVPEWEEVEFNPSFQENLYFVHLGHKQDSREGIAAYRKTPKSIRRILTTEISYITQQILKNQDSLEAFEGLLRDHEELISEALEIPRAKDLHFQDFWGEVKSLGAWGGDFVLATSTRSKKETLSYFEGKGFKVVIPYQEMKLE